MVIADQKTLTDKTVLIYGATGGIGSELCRVFKNHGARVIPGGRDRRKLLLLKEKLKLDTGIFTADYTDGEDLQGEWNRMIKSNGPVDMVINAAGHDYRTAFTTLTAEQITRTVQTNLTGPAQLFQTALAHFESRRQGTLVSIGGYGDGSMAFPYHALDAASRSGITTLFEGLRREYKNRNINFLYFCPPAVETDTEKAYFPLWESIGIKRVTPEQVGLSLIKALKTGKPWHMMGSCIDRFGVKLNRIWPELANMIFLNTMGQKMIRFINKQQHREV